MQTLRARPHRLLRLPHPAFRLLDSIREHREKREDLLLRRRCPLRRLARVKQIMPRRLSRRRMRKPSPLDDHQRKRRRVTQQVDLQPERFYTTNARHTPLSKRLSHLEPPEQQKRIVRACNLRKNRLARMRIPLRTATNTLNRNDHRDRGNAQRRKASLHDKPHASDSFRPRFASDISRRDSYRPVKTFDASLANRHGRMPKLTA